MIGRAGPQWPTASMVTTRAAIHHDWAADHCFAGPPYDLGHDIGSGEYVQNRVRNLYLLVGTGR
jgi:hypothetical protein